MFYQKLLPLALCVMTPAIYAATCPPPELVKAAVFNHAELYDDSSDLWELVSAPFMYEDKQWDLSYGLYIENASSAADAMRQGQLRFQQDALIHPNPPAVPIPGHIFCDYTESGMMYWIQAMTPPGK